MLGMNKLTVALIVLISGMATSLVLALAVSATSGYDSGDGLRTVTFHGHPSGGQQAALDAWLDWCAKGNHRETNPVGCVLSWSL